MTHMTHDMKKLLLCCTGREPHRHGYRCLCVVTAPESPCRWLAFTWPRLARHSTSNQKMRTKAPPNFAWFFTHQLSCEWCDDCDCAHFFFVQHAAPARKKEKKNRKLGHRNRTEERSISAAAPAAVGLLEAYHRVRHRRRRRRRRDDGDWRTR